MSMMGIRGSGQAFGEGDEGVEDLFTDADLPTDEPGEAPDPEGESPEQVAARRLAEQNYEDEDGAAVVDDDAEVEPAPATGEEPAGAEEVVAGETPLFAGKFKTQEALERGYTEVASAFTRVTQDNAAIRRQNEEIAARNEAQQQQIDAMMEYLQAAAMEDNPELAQAIQTQRLVDERVQQQVAPLQDQLAAEQQQAQVQRSQSEASANVAAFYAEHPDIEPGSPTDIALTHEIERVVSTLGRAGFPLDFSDRRQLDLAVEAATNPAFGAELMMAPNALAVPGGIDILRQRSGATISATEAPGNGTPSRQGPVRRRMEGYVETGSGGAPMDAAPGTRPADEFDEAAAYYEQTFKRGPLFGQAR